MLNLTNLLIIIIILFILNYIKINNSDELYTENTNIKQKKNAIKKYDINYGKEQLITNNNFEQPKFDYQNIDFLIKNNEFELSKIHNFDYDEKKIISDFQKETLNGVTSHLIDDPINLPSNTNILCEQKTIYDYKFEEPKRKKLEKIIKQEDINFDNKTIKDVYDDLIIDYKNINPKKKLINENNNGKINGGFGESSLSHIDWIYEDDDNFGYIPNEPLELSLV